MPYRRTVLVVAVLVLAVAVQAGSKKAHEDEIERIKADLETSFEIYDRMERAIAEGRDAELINLVCMKMPVSLFQLMALSERIDYQHIYDAVREAMHRRYDEVCQAPGNVDDLFNLSYRDEKRCWDEAGFSFSFNGNGVASRSDSDMPCGSIFYPNSGECKFTDGDISTFYAAICRDEDAFRIEFDFDPDGEPDLVFDGKEIDLRKNWALLQDEGPGGCRNQWLLAEPGGNPRQQARLMLYRDGPLFLFLFDTDGDGNGNCGRSASSYLEGQNLSALCGSEKKSR